MSSSGAGARARRERDQERDGAERLSANDENAVDRREPVRLERHHPVERRERDRQPVRRSPPPLSICIRRASARSPVRSCSKRPRVQEIRERVPAGEVEWPREPRKTEVQIRALWRRISSCRQGPRASTRRGGASEEDRQKQNGQNGKTRVAAPIGRRMTTPHAPPES